MLFNMKKKFKTKSKWTNYLTTTYKTWPFILALSVKQETPRKGNTEKPIFAKGNNSIASIHHSELRNEKAIGKGQEGEAAAEFPWNPKHATQLRRYPKHL